jgi:drug/metabolite transporter (DMT)-like permease
VPQALRNWKLGFALAMTTAVMWGFLPIALKVALEEVDAWTITWCRFAGAWITVGVWLATQRALPFARLREGKIWRWLLPGCLGLTFNYTLYVLGLRYTSPAVTQVVMQIAPPMLLLLGMFFFKERFSRVQWLGFATLLVGLMVFFNRRLPELLKPGEGFSFGIFLLVISSIGWAIYGLSQKTLSRHLTSAQILFLIYGGATLLLLPTVNFGALLSVHRPAFLALLFGIANTVAAYGAFGLALEVWEVSRVSSVVCAAPLFTVVGSLIASQAAITWVVPETLNTLSIVGACAVVGGSMISALGGRKP